MFLALLLSFLLSLAARMPRGRSTSSCSNSRKRTLVRIVVGGGRRRFGELGVTRLFQPHWTRRSLSPTRLLLASNLQRSSTKYIIRSSTFELFLALKWRRRRYWCYMGAFLNQKCKIMDSNDILAQVLPKCHNILQTSQHCFICVM